MHDVHDFIRTVILDFLFFRLQCEAKHPVLYASPECDLFFVCVFPDFFTFLVTGGGGVDGFGDCMMQTICLPCRIFDVFAEVKRQSGLLAVALTHSIK